MVTHLLLAGVVRTVLGTIASAVMMLVLICFSESSNGQPICVIKSITSYHGATICTGKVI